MTIAARAGTEAQPVRVLILGAGFGGLELAARLSEELRDRVEVVLIDKSDGFVFGFSKLDVMFGRTTEDAVVHRYGDVIKPGVQFVQATILSIDPEQRRVVTDAGEFDGDAMVVALGADLEPGATPGLIEAGHEFYTVPGAFALRDVLAGFAGGRVVVGVTSTPFKCPPAPSETALLVHDYLLRRGLRDRSTISLVMPMGAPIPPSQAASESLLGAFAARDIQWCPGTQIVSLDPSARCAVTASGEPIEFDLFLGVPRHVAPEVVLRSGLCVDGWVPVNPRTLETRFTGVYAVGDVTSVGTPKAGVFAEGQARVAAEAIIARANGSRSQFEYDGRGQCYLEFGNDEVARVDVAFAPGVRPTGTFDGPSAELAAHKAEFGASRVRRWFGREWSTH